MPAQPTIIALTWKHGGDFSPTKRFWDLDFAPQAPLPPQSTDSGTVLLGALFFGALLLAFSSHEGGQARPS